MGGNPSKGKPKLSKIDKLPSLCTRIGLCNEEVADEVISLRIQLIMDFVEFLMSKYLFFIAQTENWLQTLKRECNDLKDSCEWALHVRKALSNFRGFPPAYFR